MTTGQDGVASAWQGDRMGDLVKILGRFLTRDLVYIVGGSLVIAAFAHAFCCISPWTPHTGFALPSVS